MHKVTIYPPLQLLEPLCEYLTEQGFESFELPVDESIEPAWVAVYTASGTEKLKTVLAVSRFSSLRYVEEILPDKIWEEVWLEWYKPQEIGRRIVIVPPWEEQQAKVGTVKIVLNPRSAFGAGTHPTTRLMLSMLEQEFDETASASFLDVGCGSGILSVYAALRGVPTVVGVDLDATAVEIAQENAQRNYCSQCQFTTTFPLGVKFDVVGANIITSGLYELQEKLQLATASRLVVSGILDEELPEVLARFDLPLLTTTNLGEWCGIVFALNKK